MDVDGVLTDGRIILGKGEELKSFDVHDGMGLSIAKKAGLRLGIITGRSSEAVERRAKELDIDVLLQGSKNKLRSLQEIMKKEYLNYQQICYIGDDIIDLPLFKIVGFSATVADAPDSIKSQVSYIATKPGGRGAVREIIEYILTSKGILQSTIDALLLDWNNL